MLEAREGMDSQLPVVLAFLELSILRRDDWGPCIQPCHRLLLLSQWEGMEARLPSDGNPMYRLGTSGDTDKAPAPSLSKMEQRSL